MNICGGSAIEDECGVCGGPGAIYECGCEELPGGGGDIADGCDLPSNTLYLTSSGEVLYNSTDAIGGFQFTLARTYSPVGTSKFSARRARCPL